MFNSAQIIFLALAIVFGGLGIYLFIHPSLHADADEVPFYVGGGLAVIAAGICGYLVHKFSYKSMLKSRLTVDDPRALRRYNRHRKKFSWGDKKPKFSM